MVPQDRVAARLRVMPEPRAPRAARAATRSALADLSVAAALWGGLYVVSARTFDAIPPATLTLLRLGIGVAALLLVGRVRGESTGWSRVPRRATVVAGAVAAASSPSASGTIWSR